MISIQRIQQRRRRSALTCVAALSACMGLGALGCGGNQSDAEYPEESYNEAPPPDPYSGMEVAPEEPGAPGDPNAVPGGEPETMPGEQPGTMPGDQPGAPGQPGQPAQPGAAPGEPGAPGPQGATPQETAPTAKVTTEEVDAFSTCLVKIMELQKTFEQRAEQGEPQQQLQTEFQQQAVAILNQEGLSPQRYDEIARLMSQDPQLQQRVREAIEAEAQS